MILAILRAQLLSLRGFGMRRSAASLLGLIPTLLFFLFWAGFAFGACLILSELTDLKQLAPALGAGLFGVFLYWQIAPVITASMGASLDLQKLIVYPIPLDKLFAIDVMLRFLTVGEMLVILAGAFAGILRNPVFGGAAALVRLVPATLLFVLFNLLVAAGIRSMIERLFRRKRVREVGMLVFVLLCAAPGTLIALKVPKSLLIAYLPLQNFWPWAATARWWLAQSPLEAAGVTALWIVIAYRFGRKQFYQSLREDPFAGKAAVKKRPGSMEWLEPVYRLPSRFFRDPFAVMIEKEIRALTRCAGFRLAFIMGFTFGLLIFIPNLLRPHEGVSAIQQHFLAWVSLYSLMLVGFYTFLNAFGFDRSAVQFYFAAPVSFRSVMAAKNVAAVFFQMLEVLLITIVFSLFPIPFNPMGIAEAFAVTAVACLYAFAIGNLTSVRFPVPMDPDKMSRGGVSSRGKIALITLLFPVAFLPIGLAYWGGYVFHSQAVFFGLLLLAAVIGGIVYWVATDSALDVTLQRREDMIASLTRGEGPMSMGG
jgi:ABC-2 type transport system permease protein